MANSNRTRGHSFERDVVRKLKELGWDAATSRYTSRRLDDSGVDIDSDFPYKIQCKATVRLRKVYDLLEASAADVIFWRRMEKQGKRFFAKEEYAILPMDEFLKLVKQLNRR